MRPDVSKKQKRKVTGEYPVVVDERGNPVITVRKDGTMTDRRSTRGER